MKDDMWTVVGWVFVAAYLGFLIGMAVGRRSERGWVLEERVARLERRVEPANDKA